jgi:hypothetical protein
MLEEHSLVRYDPAVGNRRWSGHPPLAKLHQVGRSRAALWSDMVVSCVVRQFGFDRLLRVRPDCRGTSLTSQCFTDSLQGRTMVVPKAGVSLD